MKEVIEELNKLKDKYKSNLRLIDLLLLTIEDVEDRKEIIDSWLIDETEQEIEIEED